MVLNVEFRVWNYIDFILFFWSINSFDQMFVALRVFLRSGVQEGEGEITLS